jgi:hypothetical protein
MQETPSNQKWKKLKISSNLHEDKDKKQIFSIQHERLTPSKNHLDFLDKDEKEYFGVALFFTVLTDMVCYTYYRDNYEKFQSLTRYPKLIGNCLSWCRYHLHPRDMFYAMNQGRKPSEPQLLFIDKFSDAIDTMKKETVGFFKEHLSEINGEIFWENCQREFPFRNNHIKTKTEQ